MTMTPARKAALALLADQVSLVESAGLDAVARELLAIVMRESKHDMADQARREMDELPPAIRAGRILEVSRRFWGSLTPEEQAAMREAWSETIELPGQPAEGKER